MGDQRVRTGQHLLYEDPQGIQGFEGQRNGSRSVEPNLVLLARLRHCGTCGKLAPQPAMVDYMAAWTLEFTSSGPVNCCTLIPRNISIACEGTPFCWS